MNKEEIKKIGESYIWKATIGDKVIEEYVKTSNNKFEMTSFDEIQQKPDFEKFELIGQNNEISLDKNGIFNILDDLIQFTIVDNKSNKELLSGPKNNLMMYRTNEQDLKNGGRVRVVAYVFGYKTHNPLIFFKVKFHITTKKVYFTIECSPKEDLDTTLKIIKNGTIIKSQNIKFEKNKKINITI